MIYLKSSDEKQKDGKIIYNDVEKSFDFSPLQNSDIILLVAYINIGFDSETMLANQIWGFSPKENWIREEIIIPSKLKKCALKLTGDFNIGSWRLDRGNSWKTFFDENSGWIRVGDNYTGDGYAVNFIENAIAILNHRGELKTLLLNPCVSNY